MGGELLFMQFVCLSKQKVPGAPRKSCDNSLAQGPRTLVGCLNHSIVHYITVYVCVYVCMYVYIYIYTHMYNIILLAALYYNMLYIINQRTPGAAEHAASPRDARWDRSRNGCMYVCSVM